MSRILFGWELGSNHGHLSRLLPLACGLRTRGHEVLFAVRDLNLAAQTLASLGLPFVAAPRAAVLQRFEGIPANYADLLWRQGWADCQALSTAVEDWLHILRQFAPAVAVLDYAPTALLAARILGTTCALLGTGFELPPLTNPLPPLPGFTGATVEAARRVEARALEHANYVMSQLQGPTLEALRDLFRAEYRWLTTLPELDHYGARKGERYVGPIGEGLIVKSVRWPVASTQRVIAYLRPGTETVPWLLEALARSEAAVLCYAPGIPPDWIERWRSSRLLFCQHPIDLSSVLEEAALSVSYASAATAATMALHGIPQLLSPAHAESQLTAQRIEGLGMGLTIHPKQGRESVEITLQRLLQGVQFVLRARTFAQRYRTFALNEKREEIVEAIDRMTQRRPLALHHLVT
jgi:UDP:flavonoid glycosyltransferase YjiC (YdhE family)